MVPSFRRGSAIAASAALAAVLTLVLLAGPAAAHEQRPVGAFQLTVGWQHEPTYTGILNAVQLFVKDAKGNPVDSLGTPPTLQVVVITGTQTSSPLELKASFDPDTGLGTHGEFDAAVIPTAPGIYTFHFTGSINGQKMDEKFTSSDTTFDSVEDPTEVEFPSKLPNTADLATNVARINPRVDSAVAAAKSAQDKANSANSLAVVALAVGAVLGLGGLLVGIYARRARG